MIYPYNTRLTRCSVNSIHLSGHQKALSHYQVEVLFAYGRIPKNRASLLPFSLRRPAIVGRITIRRSCTDWSSRRYLPYSPDLVAGIRRRDPHVLSWVYATYSPRLYHYLLQRLGNLDLARDARHGVFIRFIERAADVEDRGVPLAASLFRLARNLTIDLR